MSSPDGNPPTPPDPKIVEVTRRHADGTTETYSGDPTAIAALLRAQQPFTVGKLPTDSKPPTDTPPTPVAHIQPPTPEPQPAPPITDPYAHPAVTPPAIETHSVPPTQWLSTQVHPDQTGTNNPNSESAVATPPPQNTERFINWQALNRLRRRKQQTQEAAEEIQRKSDRRAGGHVLAGLVIGAVLAIGAGQVVENATYAVLPQTLPAGKCLDTVPAGTIITARDYSIDGKKADPDGANTSTIILYENAGSQFCTYSTEAHYQETGNADPEFLGEMQLKYQDQLRTGFPLFNIVYH